jgi:hypothetical protein
MLSEDPNNNIRACILRLAETVFPEDRIGYVEEPFHITSRTESPTFHSLGCTLVVSQLHHDRRAGTQGYRIQNL